MDSTRFYIDRTSILVWIDPDRKREELRLLRKSIAAYTFANWSQAPNCYRFAFSQPSQETLENTANSIALLPPTATGEMRKHYVSYLELSIDFETDNRDQAEQLGARGPAPRR